MQTLYIILLSSLSVFMILLILIQRGKGGGLAGAFGGMGGQSAFGTKAGDAFTRITVIVATCWFILCIFAIWSLKWDGGKRFRVGDGGASASQLSTDTTGEGGVAASNEGEIPVSTVPVPTDTAPASGE